MCWTAVKHALPLALINSLRKMNSYAVAMAPTLQDMELG